MKHTIKHVEALWPRINQTYKFDSVERRSVPCTPQDQNAAYELSFKMTEGQAKELYADMMKAYTAKREPSWPEKIAMPFKKDTQDGVETGCFIGKCKLKGAYNGEATPKPKQYDRDGSGLAEDFMLTTGSKVNIAVTFVPYNMREAGVSLRLRAVQVLEYKEMEERNPFEAEGAPVAPSAPTSPVPSGEVDPFGLPPTTPAPAPASADFDDEIPF